MTPSSCSTLSVSPPTPIEIPSAPVPLVLTVASTSRHSVYSLNAPLALCHRSMKPLENETTNALVRAVVDGLSTITPTRMQGYQYVRRAHDQAIELDRAMDEGREAKKIEHSKVPMEIRTNSKQLLEAGTYLQTLASSPVNIGDSNELHYQLQRFDVAWQLLPANSAEIAALERFARLNCSPNGSAFRDGPNIPTIKPEFN
jgi:hypothetical protein